MYPKALLLGSCLWLAALGCLSARSGTAEADDEPQAKVREFQFTYEATVTGLKPGQEAHIWIPVAADTPHQEAKVTFKALPGKARETKEDTYGNRFYYIEANADSDGKIPLKVTYRVKRHEVLGDKKTRDEKVVQRFLQADKLVPLEGKHLDLIKGKELPEDQLKLGKTLYDVVNDYMTYSKKGEGWGRGDVLWVCDAKYGNCTDFHSLFIALARSKKVPAKFEMGFPLPEARGMGEVSGYHCWAWFKPKGHGWVPVDISEANRAKDTKPRLTEYYFGNLTENRVAFTTGRDITLAPKQSGPPVNYIIYPYVEVGGQPYPLEKISRRFSYQDLK